MSQPKRYSLVASYYCSDAKMEAFEDGEYVRHADYAAIKAENERLTDYLDRIDLAIGKADYEQALDILIEWRRERKDLP